MRTLRWSVIFLGIPLGLLLTASRAPGLDRGLYEIEGSRSVYYVSDDGVRHFVRDPDTIRTTTVFRDMPVVKTTYQQIRTMPRGEIITTTTAPDILTRKTTVKRVQTTTTEPAQTSRLVVEYGSPVQRVTVSDIDLVHRAHDVSELVTLTGGEVVSVEAKPRLFLETGSDGERIEIDDFSTIKSASDIDEMVDLVTTRETTTIRE